MANVAATVEEYIAQFPPDQRVELHKVRETVRQLAPGSVETIAFDMPTVMANGKLLLHYSGAKRNLTISGIPTQSPGLERELAEYRDDKGALTFAYRQGIPHELISRTIEAVLKAQSA